MKELPIYLDYMATTPLAKEVAQAMSMALSETALQGNAASRHAYGDHAQACIEEARSEVARLLNAAAKEIIFTAGATESNYIAIRGAAYAKIKEGKHLITTAIEHKSVLALFQQLEEEGFSVTYLPVDSQGRLYIQTLQQAIRPETTLISIMHVNNEIGTINDLEQICQLTQQHHIWLHVDAAQSVGKIPLDLQRLPIDLLSLSAHKLYGPKGMGALFRRLRPKVRLLPLLVGGGQEQGLRAGTLATHQIIGFGKACVLAKAQLSRDYQHALSLKKTLLERLTGIPLLHYNGELAQQVPYCLNICFREKGKEAINQALENLAISSGSACLAFSSDHSHVLRALGLSKTAIIQSRRFSWGRYTTVEDIEKMASLIHALYNFYP